MNVAGRTPMHMHEDAGYICCFSIHIMKAARRSPVRVIMMWWANLPSALRKMKVHSSLLGVFMMRNVNFRMRLAIYYPYLRKMRQIRMDSALSK